MSTRVSVLLVNGAPLREGRRFYLERFGLVTGPRTCALLRANKAIEYGVVYDTDGLEWSPLEVHVTEHSARRAALLYLRQQFAKLVLACEAARDRMERMEQALARTEAVTA